MNPDYLPTRNNAIKKFVSHNYSFPCYDEQTISYSLAKISSLLS